MLTVEQVRDALPKRVQTAATQSLTDKLNQISSDPEAAQIIRDNFITYSGVLKDSRFRTEDYLNAITYVTFKLMNHSNQDSYKKTFPDRYAKLMARGATEKEISSYVAIYNKNILVNELLEQCLIPTWILNQEYYQKAINIQVDLMTNASSEKVRTEAANSLLTHLKRPETKKAQISIDINNRQIEDDLSTMMESLVAAQKSLVQSGVPTAAIASQKLGQNVTLVDNGHTTPNHTTLEDVEDAEVLEGANVTEVMKKLSVEKPLTGFKPAQKEE